MKIWKIQLIDNNALRTYIVIAESRIEALECIDRHRNKSVADDNVIVEELSTARPADSKIVYSH